MTMADEFKPDLTRRVKNWIMDSLSGFNITAKIQLSIRAILGLGTDEQRKLTELEEKLVATVEQIVRRGRPLLTLFEDELIWHGFNELARQFPNEQTTILVRNPKGADIPQELQVFASLVQYAQSTRTDEIKIQEYRRLLGMTPGIFEKRRLNNQIEELKSKNVERSSLFQKIIFAEADRVERGELERILTLKGQPVHLDTLIELSLGQLEGTAEILEETSPLASGPPSNERPFGRSDEYVVPVAARLGQMPSPRPQLNHPIAPPQGPAPMRAVLPTQPPPLAARPSAPPPPATPPPLPTEHEKGKKRTEVLDWRKLQEEGLELDDSDSFKLDF
jgi:hypothetical protein